MDLCAWPVGGHREGDYLDFGNYEDCRSTMRTPTELKFRACLGSYPCMHRNLVLRVRRITRLKRQSPLSRA